MTKAERRSGAGIEASCDEALAWFVSGADYTVVFHRGGEVGVGLLEASRHMAGWDPGFGEDDRQGDRYA